jgi:pseudouridine kinase
MTGKAESRTVCCIGSTTMDRILDLQQPGMPAASNPVSSRRRRGGTARNVAENLARLDVACALLSIVGDDDAGQAVLSETAQQDVDVSLVQKSLSQATASQTVVLQPDGELFASFAEMEICRAMDRGFIQSRWFRIREAALVFVDANLPEDSLAWLIAGCREQDLVLVLDAVSPARARKLPLSLNGVDTLICNRHEARAMLGDDITRELGTMAAALCRRGARNTVVTAGADGLCYANRDEQVILQAESAEVADVSGAGDALIAGMIYGRLAGHDPRRALQAGLAAAAVAVACDDGNPQALSAEALEAALRIG